MVELPLINLFPMVLQQSKSLIKYVLRQYNESRAIAQGTLKFPVFIGAKLVRFLRIYYFSMKPFYECH